MNDQLIPKEIISDGIGQIYYILPIPFIALILAISIWVGFTKLNGEVLKGYKVYNALIAVSLATVAYYTIPVDQLKVNDIPTLIVAVITSGLFIEIFVYWRKKKSKK